MWVSQALASIVPIVADSVSLTERGGWQTVFPGHPMRVYVHSELSEFGARYALSRSKVGDGRDDRDASLLWWSGPRGRGAAVVDVEGGRSGEPE